MGYIFTSDIKNQASGYRLIWFLLLQNIIVYDNLYFSTTKKTLMDYVHN